jgi:dolichol-phosphate mannosyltransferase
VKVEPLNATTPGVARPTTGGGVERYQVALLIVGAPRSLAGDPLFVGGLEQANRDLDVVVTYVEGARDPASLLAAIAATGREIVVVMDAAYRYQTARIGEFALPLARRQVDAVFAAREHNAGESRRGFVRRLAAHTAVWPLVDAADPLSGFFAARRDRLLGLSLTPDSFDLGLELLAQNSGWLRVLDVSVAAAGEAQMPTPTVLMQRGRRLMALGGGAVSIGRATRFAAVGFIAMAVDFSVFQTLLWFGVRLGSAHIYSFAISVALNFYLNASWTFVASARETGEPLWRQYLRFLGVAVAALLLRGGVLGLASDKLGLPPQLGIVLGIGTAATVSFLGNAFFVFPTGHAAVPLAMRWRMAALGSIAFILVLRLIYIGQPNLLPEEAYYWNYAQHLDIGYLDHPPMVAWAIALTTAVFGNGEFGVRIAAALLWLATTCFALAYARNLYGKSAGLVTAMLVAVLPYTFGAAIIMSPDAPLVAAWAAALFFLERALLGERRRAWWGVGAAIGLGLLSKYTIVLLGPAVLVFVIIDPRSRHWLLRPEPYLGALLAALIFAPVILWNVENDWVSFAFQGPRRMASHFYFGLPELLGEVLLLLTPVGALAAGLVLLGRGSGALEAQRYRFVTVFTLVPVLVFVAFSLNHAVKLNWTGPSWLALFPAVAAGILATGEAAGGRVEVGLRSAWQPTVAALLLLYALGLHYLVLGLPGVPYRNDLRGLPLGWNDLARQASAVGAEVAATTGQPPVYVGIDKYTFASEMAFYGRGRDGRSPRVASANLFGGDGLMYDRWIAAGDQEGRTLVLLAYKMPELDSAAVHAHCRSLGPVVPHQALRDGRKVGRFFHRLCSGYRVAAQAG